MFVLDASVAAAWFIPDKASPYTDDVLHRLRRGSAIVPPVWTLEIANILLVAEHRGRLTEAQSTQPVQFLQDLPVGTQVGGGMESVLALGRQQTLSAYGASYLELAVREGQPLATQDRQLQAAAKRVGVPLIA